MAMETDMTNGPGRPTDSSTRLYADDSLLSFFRRPTFTPDGAWVVAPAGICKDLDDGGRLRHAVHIYARRSLSRFAKAVGD